MVERQPRVVDRRRRASRPTNASQRDGVADRRQVLRALPAGFEIRNDDDALDGGQLRRRSSATLSRIGQRLAVVPVAVDGEEHARLDLAEAVEHALHAEIRRARRPDGAEARRAEHRDRSPRACSGTYAAIAVAGARCPAPSARRRSRDVVATSSACETRRTSLSSPRNTSASPVSSAARRASRFSAKLSRASGNQRAPGICAGSTSVRSPRSPMTPAKSQSARQNASRSSVDQRHSDGVVGQRAARDARRTPREFGDVARAMRSATAATASLGRHGALRRATGAAHGVPERHAAAARESIQTIFAAPRMLRPFIGARSSCRCSCAGRQIHAHFDSPGRRAAEERAARIDDHRPVPDTLAACSPYAIRSGLLE